MSERAKKIVSELTLEEKANMCMGTDQWRLLAVERLGLSQVMVADGPHGLRKESDAPDNAYMNQSVPATCFPTACAAASSWDTDLVYEMGQAIAEEAKQEDVSVLLGPGANIKRSPLCGRNFEYFSEDPYLTGELASAFVKGVQSKNIGTSLKHFAMNNQEKYRMTIDAVVDERAQREIYLTGFEKCIKQSNPWTVMCAYNKVDGVYASENKRLLTNILRDEWGYDGLVMTDWGAVNKRDEGIKAGLDLEMPNSGIRNSRLIVEAVNDGSLLIEELDAVVERLVDLTLRSQDVLGDYKYDAENHHKLAKKVAEESAVLLANDGILPLQKASDIAIIGEFAKVPRYQGAGSSIINPTKVDNVCEILDAKGLSYEYAQGYSIKTDEVDYELISQAVEVTKKHEYAIVFAGLTDSYESEAFDRDNLDIPPNHSALIDAVSQANENVIVVLSNGSPITMPWLSKANAVLEGYLHGQAGAGAIVDILFGDICPSGKLAETFPNKLEDTPCYNYFPGYERSVEYRESIYVGYRYYDKAQKSVLFPFGHGLSYTQFKYSDLKVKKTDDFEYTVSFSIANVGEYDGAEIAQVYVKNNESPIFKAEKELKAFKKVFLKKGEKQTVEIKLDKRSFAYYNVKINDWHVDSGTYAVLVGASSQDIKLQKQVKIKAVDEITVPDYYDALPCYYNLKDEVLTIKENDFEKLLGRKLPKRQREKGEEYDLESTLSDIKGTFIGKIINKAAAKRLAAMVPEGQKPEENTSYMMMYNMAKDMPLKSIGMSGDVRPYMAEAVVAFANKEFIKGLSYLLMN